MRQARNYLALSIGLCLAVALICCIVWKAEYVATSELATGTVMRLNHGSHHAEISFRARDGRTYERPMSSLWGITPGEPIQIRYIPKDPLVSASIDTIADVWIGILFLAILTTAFLLGGIRGLPFKGDVEQ